MCLNFFFFVEPVVKVRKTFASDGYYVSKYILFKADFLMGFLICLQNNVLTTFMFHKILLLLASKKISKGYCAKKEVYQRQDFKIKFSLDFSSHDTISVSKIFICNRVHA